MKMIVITPANDADAERLLFHCQELAKTCYGLEKGSSVFNILARCTAVALTDAPANPPGWDKVDTSTLDCTP